MATTWTNAVAQDYVLCMRNSTKTSAVMPSVMSETQEDLLVYDTEMYRDELDSSYLGRAWNETGPSYSVPFAAGTDVPESTDDRFQHEPQRPVEKTRSRFYWWTGASGTGSVVGAAWVDQVISLTPVQVQRF